MKKILLLSLILFSCGLSNAATYYWTGGTGAWNDPGHWSASSGGASAGTIPTGNDDVFFDDHSFSSPAQTVMITVDAACHNIDFSRISRQIILSCAASRKLTVNGSLILSPLLRNGCKGTFVMAGSGSISTAGIELIGNLEIRSGGNYLLGDDLSMAATTTLKLVKGSLNTAGKKLEIGNFNGCSSFSRTLILGSSEIFVTNTWDLSNSSNLTFDSGTSRLAFVNSLDSAHFRDGGQRYYSVSAVAAACSPSSTPCANFTITLTGTNVDCNGNANGTATAVIAGGSGSFTYDWSPGTPTGDFTPSISGLGAGTYTVKVTDASTGLFCFCSIQIIEPGVLFDFELFMVSPLCNGQCNGSAAVDATGGTPPYTYVWTPTGITNDTALALCAATYTVSVTDSKGCIGSTTIDVTEPAVLVAPGSFTNVTCFGFCDGTASVTVSGGTTPYVYNWLPGSPSGDGTGSITNLCPGTYTCNVTDAHGCTASYSTTITQPPLLTLAVSHTNATCGGVCDGTATATVSGGTTPYTYVWSNGSSVVTSSTTNVISGLCAGSYTIQVTDANGCVQSGTVVITQPPVLVVTASGVNVTCNAACNGSAAAVAVGGTVGPGYTYDWTPGTPVGDGTANISNLCPGTYTITVTDINGCTDFDTTIITQPPPLNAQTSNTNLLCAGTCTGTATAAGTTGGTPGYSYNWLPGTPSGDGTVSISSLCTGTYSVVVTDANGCIDTSAQFTVTSPLVLNSNVTFTNVTCNGACNGTVTASPSGGVGGYTYSWSTGAVTPGISSLCPGTYSVTVTDANGCTATGSATITQPNVLNVTASATTLSCNGDCNATASAVVTGGTPGFTFDWLPGSPLGDGTGAVNSLCAGSYTVNVVDNNGCLASANFSISQPSALSLITATSDASCFGICDGSAAAIAGGGTPGYSYSWAPVSLNTAVITGQCAGTYTVTLTDANGCTRMDTVTINQPNQLFGNPSVVNNITCAGMCNGSATSAAAGGSPPYVYNWSPGAPAGDGTPTITNLCVGSYTLTVTDSNSCSVSQSVSITQPLILSAPITGSTSSCNICNGTATVSPAGGTPPYTFNWLPTGQTGGTATGLCPNVTYTVTVTDANGCVASNTVTILQTIIINITTSNTTLTCSGACDGIATANASGGTVPYSYLWVDSAGIVSVNQTATGLCAGSYSVTVSDAIGCFNTDTVTFTNPPALTLTVTSTNATCAGVCDGTATTTVTGGTAPYSYSWSSGGYTGSSETTLCSGTYTVTVTDANGCTDTVHINIIEPSSVVDNVVVTAANCTLADGNITVAPTGGSGVYTYNWGPGAPVGDGTPTISNLFPGAYTLAITSGACTYNFNYLVNNITGPALVMNHTNVSCFNACNGTATVSASGGAGGYVYDWSPGAPTGDLTATATALCGNITYTVQVTDAAGCIALDTATIINPSLISPNPTIVNESCGGTCNGSISLAPTGGTPGYTYSWSTGSTGSAISGLCAGSYSVTVTDANGCDSVLNITIVSPPTLIVSVASTNVLCNSACNGTATATVSGGTGPGTYVYAWSHGSAYVLPNVINLCPGTYSVTVTDNNGCSAVDSAIITEPTPLTSFTSQTNATCFGTCNGIGIVTPAGGTLPYSYMWSPGGIANDTATGLCAGSYNATVTDANGCVSNPPPVVILQPAAIAANITSVDPKCNGSCDGTATAAPTGGSGGYTYSWMAGGASTATATNLCAGTYTVTVTDLAGCSISQNVTLTNPMILNANAVTTSPTCSTGCNGSATVNPSGGTAGYTYSWLPGGASTQTIGSLCPGNYQVIVSDANNCKDTQVVTVAAPPGIDIVIGSTPASCGLCDGTISVNPLTGLAPYTYFWNPSAAPFSGQGTPNATNVCAGLYNLTVTDANGCDSTFVIPMNNSSGPTGETVTTVDASCFGTCNGSGSIVPVGGIPPYTYLWNDPAATPGPAAVNLCAGNYFVQVTDASGCIHFSPVTINEPAPILSNAIVTNAICSTVCTGAITVSPSGGTPGYTYNWTPGAITGQGTASVTGLCPGTYTLTITDANSCIKVDSFTIGQSTPLAATIGSTNISCSGLCNGMAYVNISSGTGPFTIQWNDPMGQANDTASALCAGNYSVDITDANGCILTLSTTITAMPPVSANPVITNASCGLCNGSAALAPTGGTPAFSYLWSNGQTGSSASSLCAGLYTVTITDSAGCVSSVNIPVSNSSGPSSVTAATTNVSCFGLADGAVTSATPVGGTAPYSYLWIASGQTTSTITGLTAGIYYVQVTDASGCSVTDSVTITQPAQLTANQNVTAATCGVCDGAITIVPAGGASPYSVLWNTGSSSLALSSLCAGVYSVQITDNNGCGQNVTIPVNSQNGPTLAVSATDVSCNGSCNGTATVSASGGTSPYAYLWNDVAAQTTPVATALCAGTYFVQVTGADGCVSVASTAVTQPSPLAFSVANAIDPFCNGNFNGSITVIPSGGTLSYNYSWTPAPAAGQTSSTATGLDANTYNVTVTDANGCTASQSVTLINPPSLTISSVVTSPSCNTIADGAIDVTIGGGTLPYSFQWSGCSSATTEDLSSLLPCNYIITVTDSNNCVIADTSTLVALQNVNAVAGNDTAFCEGGSVTISAAASTGGINYNWFVMPANTAAGSGTTLTVTPPTGPTGYYVVVDNGTGCADNDTVLVTSNPLPNADAGPDQVIVIGAGVTIGGSPTTSAAGATISWTPAGGLDNPVAANPFAKPAITTTYVVTVTTPQGCSSSDSVVVTVRPTIIIPDGISPNGDGANDEWMIDGIDLFPNCTVEVYNRWGELLFQSPGYKEHWKGTYKKKDLPVGTYYYIINLNDPLFPDPYTGPITIMR